MEQSFYNKAIEKMNDTQKNELIRKVLFEETATLAGTIQSISMKAEGTYESSTDYVKMYNETKDKMISLGIWRQEYNDAFELAKEGNFGEVKMEGLYKIIVEGKK